MYCFGTEDTLKALEMGAVEKLIVWEDLELLRLVSTHPDGKEDSYFVTAKQVEDKKYHRDAETGAQLEVETQLVVEWLAENYKKFGCQLEFVTNKSQEGFQFVKGFGGLGGILRYQIDFLEMRNQEEAAEEGESGPVGGEDWDDDDFM
eukprot:NODE_969_length_1345_cov_63.952932_g803_i0.p1 GENE.NODE_969_length_1345_cov_63.952932_g803_i0~~NODE_969_length_1345_cov_63.952932_g803_i0.p1  ORF type:complete len:148 (-),score=57.74 NODE_969_length_1345_cov_63.952932_g803_i0:458-901(-)